jgi:hypothetical protein
VAKAILITGSAEAGKTEIAKAIARQFYPAEVAILPMALVLKETAKDRLGWDGKKDERGRKLLQHLGDVGRDYDPDIWVNHSLRRWQMKEIMHDGLQLFVADDVRYLNEIERVSQSFGPENVFVIRVERDKSGLTGEASQHRSETSYLDTPYDVLIVNNGSLDDLGAEVIRHLITIL